MTSRIGKGCGQPDIDIFVLNLNPSFDIESAFINGIVSPFQGDFAVADGGG